MNVRLHFPVSSFIQAPRMLLEAGGKGMLSVPVRYGIVEHPHHGPILIDTGYTHGLWEAKGVGLAVYRRLMAPQLIPSLTPAAALARLGHRPEDVRHVVVTHLHADHVCGLAEFSHATFHVSGTTKRAWETPGRWQDLTEAVFRSLLPSASQLQAMEATPSVPLPFLPAGELGHDLLGDETVLLVALNGHQDGHVGVLVQTSEGPVLYAVDTAWTAKGYREGRLPPAPLRWVVSNPQDVLDACSTVRRAEEMGYPVVLCHEPQSTPWDMKEGP